MSVMLLFNTDMARKYNVTKEQTVIKGIGTVIRAIALNQHRHKQLATLQTFNSHPSKVTPICHGITSNRNTIVDYAILI